MAISPSGGSSQAAVESASPASGSGSIGSGEATSNLPNIGIAQPNEGDSGSKMTPVRKLYNTRYLKLLLIFPLGLASPALPGRTLWKWGLPRTCVPVLLMRNNRMCSVR